MYKENRMPHPNTSPHQTVDKNNKLTTVHRKNDSSALSADSRKLPSVPALKEEAPRTTLKDCNDVKVGDIVWDDEVGFAVSMITSGFPRFSSPGTPARPIFHSSEGRYWMMRRPNEKVLVLRDETVQEEYCDDSGW